MAKANIFFAVLILAVVIKSHSAISPGRSGVLTREQFHKLDSDVKDFYDETYGDLDARNVSFDEQLFRSIRSIRHTIVINHNDFKYTNEDFKLQAMGSSVDKNKCRQQLFILAELAKKVDEELRRGGGSPPLSVIDFLEASAHTESGVLNGNFVWLGSYSSCERARIPSDIIQLYLDADVLQRAKSMLSDDEGISTIKSRYCVAHLRAKSWPKWDIYFEDRLTIRKGVCLPEPCHTAIYEQDQEIQQTVDYISRYNLAPPFNQDERYETSSLYCLPDEDSPYRQWDFGSKMFFAFAAFWIILTVWANMRYYRHIETIQKLRETVDIRMIINEKKDDVILIDYEDDRDNHEDDDENCNEEPVGGIESEAATTRRAKSAEEPRRSVVGEQQRKGSKAKLNKNLLQAGARQLKRQFRGFSGDSMCKDSKRVEKAASDTRPETIEGDNESQYSLSTASSRSSLADTPLPSDMEETDVEFIEPFQGESQGQKKKLTKASSEGRTKQSANFDYDDQRELLRFSGFDWTRAFCIEANYNFLVRPRSNLVPIVQEAQQLRAQRDGRASSRAGAYERSRGCQQLAAVARRTSSSNDKLIKELQQQDSGVAIVSKSELGHEEQKRGSRERRVNIEVLDGLKVIATSYIVFGHTLMFFFGCTNDLRFASERMLDITMAASINTLQVVGLFYIITGCLLTYLSFSRTKLKQLLSPLFWLLVMIGRYFRLLPAYLIVFWFSRHVAPFLGAGRDWYDYRTDVEHPRGFCGQESWWTMWTMSAADIKIPMDCVPQAWYLSDDFRTLLVLPLFVYLLARNMFLGYAAIFATLAFCNLRLVTVLRNANIDYKILLAWQPHVYSLMADRLHDVYTDFYVRISTYLLGVVVGHVLYLYEIKRIKELPKMLRLLGMKLALAAGIVLYFGAKFIANPYFNQFLPSAKTVTSDTVVLLIPIFKVTMELCLCIMVLLLVTGGGNRIVRGLLSNPTMKILSNISYAVFLTHVEIMYKLPGFRFESSYAYLLVYAIFFVSTAHVVAFFLHLLYEMPINYIVRHLFKRAFASFK